MRVCFDALKVLALLLVAVIAPTLAAQAVERRDVLVLGEQRRVALVLGNSDYLTAQPLANAATDARAMEELLKSLDFEVISGFDLNKADTQKTIAHFAKIVRGAEIALFFYAGHGMQVSGVNYLIPVDAVTARAIRGPTRRSARSSGYQAAPVTSDSWMRPTSASAVAKA